MTSRGSAPVLPQRVCFFGTYPGSYTVSQILLRAVRDTGVEVVECHRPLWEEQQTKAASYFALPGLARHAVAYAAAARALAAQLRALPAADLFVVGFQGHLDALLLKYLLRRAARPILFAPLVSLSETLVEDRRVFRHGSPQARLMRWFDRRALNGVSRVVIDTHAHAEYLAAELGVPRARISVWHLGCDTQVFRRAVARRLGATTRLLFYGSFLPLHGVETILAAADRLREHADISFELYGDGIEAAACRAEAERRRLGNLRFHPWQSYESLGDLVASHDICLGVFGGGQKTRMVIPNKVYQTAAVGRPVITADTPAVREVFRHGESIWLCRADDGAALAAAVLSLARDPTRAEAIGSAAADLMAEQFSNQQQAARIAAILAETCAA